MATLRTSLALYDGITSPLLKISNAMNMVISGFESLQDASGNAINTETLSAARRELAQAEVELNAIETSVESINRDQQKWNKSIQAGSSLLHRIGGYLGAYVGLQGLQNLFSLSDQNVSATARLNLLVDGDEEQLAALQDQLMASAERSRASYLSTANAVAQIGMQTGDVFDTTGELIQFVETLNKQYVIAGASTQAAEAATTQLTQAMASGVLRGEELNSVFEQAQPVAQAIADYLGVDIGQIRALASEGQITADIVKNAMLEATEEVNAQFESMPMTWGQVWNQFQNFALQALQPVLSGINFLANNLDLLLPIVIGVGAAFGVILLAANWTNIATAATNGLATAQKLLGDAMKTAWGPPLLAIIAVIAAVYLLTAAYNRMTGNTVSATGLIIGALFSLASFALNGVVIPILNGFSMLGNFIGNFLNDPVAAVKVLLYDMAINAIGQIQNIVEALEGLVNLIPGVSVNLTSWLDNVYSNLKSGRQEVIDSSNYVEYFKMQDYIDLGGAFSSGYDIGANLLSGFDSALPDFGTGVSGIQSTIDDISGDTSSISDSVEMSEEDLKYLRDITNRDAINRFTTAQIRIDQRNENHIGSDMDVDGIMNRWTEGFVREMNVSAEGVHI